MRFNRLIGARKSAINRRSVLAEILNTIRAADQFQRPAERQQFSQFDIGALTDEQVNALFKRLKTLSYVTRK